MTRYTADNVSHGQGARPRWAITALPAVCRRPLDIMSLRDARRFASAMLPVLLISCSAAPMAPGSATAQEAAPVPFDAPPRGTRDDAQLMYQIMIAELAGRRGRLDIALQGYGAAALDSDDARVSERAARLAIFGRDWSAASRALGRWRELDPDDQEPLGLQGQVLMRQQQPEQAAERFAERVELADDAEQALAELGALLQGDPDAEVASGVADALVERFPASASARLAVARLALAGGDRPSAVEALDTALELDPDNIDAIQVSARLMAVDGDVDGAFAMLAEAIERQPDAVSLRLGEAQLLVEAGRIEAAGDALQRLGDAAAGDADTLLAIGQLAMQVGRTDLAVGWFSALLSQDEHRDEAHFQLARIADRAGEADEAIAGYDAVGSEARFVSAQLRAAELVAARGDIAAARERLGNLRQMVPDPSIQAGLVSTEGRLLQRAGQAEEALSVLSQGLEQFPDSSDLLYARALAADGAGQPEVLVSDLRRLIEVEADNAQALNALGYHFAQRNERLDEADELLVKASQLLPEDPAVMDSLGWLRFRQGDIDTAIGLLREALALLPDAEIAAHLGEALWVDGQRDEARRVWDEALQDAPDHEVLTETIERLTQ